MSDLFKDHRPELTDDEDRRLWQRVRALPDEAGSAKPVATPWWRTLWAMPAVRFGAPAFAVVLVAVVWVVARSPEPPAREAAREVAAKAAAPVNESAPAPANEPAPVPAREPDRAAAERKLDFATPPERAQAAGGAPASEPATRGTKEAGPGEAAMAKDQAIAGRVESEARTTADALAPQAAAPASPTPAPPAAKTAQKTAPKVDERAAPMAQFKAQAPSASANLTAPPGQGPAEFGAVDRLNLGTLPTPAELARHEIVAAVVDAPHRGALNARVDVPGTHAWVREIDGVQVTVAAPVEGDPAVRFSEPGAQPPDQQSAPYDAVPARAQLAVLAAVFERMLGDPTRVPPAQIEALRAEVVRVDARRADTQGRARLLSMLDGALPAWPRR